MMDSPDEMIADIISRMIAGDMGTGDEWRPAATLEFLAHGLVPLCDDDDPVKAKLAKDILGDILLSMTYLELGEADEEQEAYDRQWEQIVQNVMRSDKEDDEDGLDDEDE